MNAKFKKLKQQSHAPARPAAKSAPGASSGRWLILATAGLMTAGVVWGIFEFVVWNTVPPELVGKWVVLDGPQEGATFDFYRGGAMVGRVNDQGMEKVIDARVTVDGKKIYSTTKNRQTQQYTTMVLTILTLTENRLDIQGGQGEVMHMERAE